MNINGKSKLKPKFVQWFVYKPLIEDGEFICMRKPELTYELEFLGIIRARTQQNAQQLARKTFQ